MGFLAKDYELIMWLSAMISKSYRFRTIESVIIPVNKDEKDAIGAEAYSLRNKKRSEIVNLIAGKQINFQFPISHLSKKEIIILLPKGLFNATWYCRTPHNNKPCNNCMTCALVRKALNE